jgi:hypothetical protein
MTRSLARLVSLDIEDKKGTLLQILSKFSKFSYCHSRKLKTVEIMKNFEEFFSCTLNGIGPLTELNKSHIQAAIKSAVEQKNPLVTAFDVLAKKQLGLLKEPSLNCVHLVVKEVQKIAGSQGITQRTSPNLE